MMLGPAQQAVDPDLAQVGKARIAFQRGQERWQKPDVQPGGLRGLDDLGEPPRGQGWERHHAGVRPVGPGYLGDRRDSPEYRQPASTHEARGVVEKADLDEPLVRAAPLSALT